MTTPYQPYIPQFGSPLAKKLVQAAQNANRHMPSVPDTTTTNADLMAYMQTAFRAQSFQEIYQSNNLLALSYIVAENDTTGLPVSFNLDFNATLGDNNAWTKADISQPSWQIHMVNDRFSIRHSLAGENPIIWVDYASLPATGTPTLPTDLIRLQDLRASRIRDLAEAVIAYTMGRYAPLIYTLPGTYTKVTVNEFGQVTSATTLGAADLPQLAFLVTGAVPSGLTNGRQVVAGTNISVTDSGPGGTLTIATAGSPTPAWATPNEYIQASRNEMSVQRQSYVQDAGLMSLLVRRFM